jgi:hypothetical protein
MFALKDAAARAVARAAAAPAAEHNLKLKNGAGEGNRTLVFSLEG